VIIRHPANTQAVRRISTGQRNVSKSGLRLTRFPKNGSLLLSTWTYMARTFSILEEAAANVTSAFSLRSFCRK
jgi:hypothetical protein